MLNVELPFSLIKSRRRMGGGCTDPCILDLDTNWRWEISFAARPLYPLGKSPRYPRDRRQGGPQSLAPAGNRTPAVQPVAIPAPCSSANSGGKRLEASFAWKALTSHSCSQDVGRHLAASKPPAEDSDLLRDHRTAAEVTCHFSAPPLDTVKWRSQLKLSPR
jgi:hypothetical protein